MPSKCVYSIFCSTLGGSLAKDVLPVSNPSGRKQLMTVTAGDHEANQESPNQLYTCDIILDEDDVALLQ